METQRKFRIRVEKEKYFYPQVLSKNADKEDQWYGIDALGWTCFGGMYSIAGFPTYFNTEQEAKDFIEEIQIPDRIIEL